MNIIILRLIEPKQKVKASIVFINQISQFLLIFDSNFIKYTTLGTKKIKIKKDEPTYQHSKMN